MKASQLLVTVALLGMSLPGFAPIAVAQEDVGDDPGEAADYFLLKRSPDGETLPVDKYQDALDHMKLMPLHSTRSGQTAAPLAANPAAALSLSGWTPLGPGNIGGRTRALVVDPVDPQTMYAAGVSGGVWKSTDGGASWRPMSDLLPSIAVVSLAMAPSDRNVLYAGTGEFFTGDGVRGAGIFKSTDGAVTWTRLAATDTPDFYFVNRLAVSPSNPARLYAATSTGLWRSLDGGTTWQKIISDPSFGCHEIVLRQDLPGDYALASCGVPGSVTVWRATAAATVAAGAWESVVAEAGMARTTLAFAPSNQNTVYALAADSTLNYAVHAVFRSDAGGAPGTWVALVRQTPDSDPIGRTLLSAGTGCSPSDPHTWRSQGWYDNALAVDPVDPNRVWAGGISLFRSDDGGRTWGIAVGVHADQHLIVFHPAYDGAANQTLFVANDGGLYRTQNARATVTTCAAPSPSAVAFSDLNHGYAVTQFYHGLPYPDGTRYLGGTQDNGTLRGTDATGTEGWERLFSGDGGYVAIDPRNTDVIYFTVTGFMLRSPDGGRSTFGVDPPMHTRLFIPPFLMDPNAPDRLWALGDQLFRTDNGAASWTAASTPLQSGEVFSAIAVAPGDSNRVVAGTILGRVYRTSSALTSTGSTVWASSTIPGFGFVSGVTFDPHDPTIVYATISTFGGHHVWRSADGGATWTPIDGSGSTGLPDVPVHVLVVDPADSARLYIGTDVGVFASADGGATWSVEVTGFATAPTESLSITTVGGVPYIFAFTHGRGVWRVATGAGVPGPAIAAISPSSVAAGSPAFTLTVTGSNFVSGATVSWNGAARPTTFVSTTQLTAAIGAADVATAGTATVTVRNPDGRTSSAVTFTIAGTCPTGQFFAQYFANVTLGGTPARIGCETTVNYVYGTGGPAGLPVDNFSARWTGRFAFAAGSVTFTARADDGVRVFLDGAVIIDGWRDQPATTYTATRTVTAGEHEVKVEYYERLEDAVVQVSWTGSPPPPPITLTPNTATAGGPAFTLTADGAGFVSGATLLWNGAARTTTFVSATRVTAAIPAADIAVAGAASVTVRNPDGQTSGAQTFTITAAGGGCPTGQFLAEYFANVGLTGTSARTACEGTINYNYGAGGPAGLPVDNFSVRWSGRFTFAAGATSFTARADDGVRVFVDGTLVIDGWKDQPATTYTATRTLTAGEHDVKVEYYERGGDAVIQVSWTGTVPPPPTLSTLTPSSATAGGPAFTLTADGANFVSGATLLWNGAARTTTFVSATRITAAIPAADVVAAGTASVTVRNPDGQVSSAQTFTITPAGGGCATGQFFAEYFANVTLAGTPARTACETAINYDYGAGGPAGLPVDNFSARWTGRFTFAAGTFTFTARADDGVRLFVDGALIIDGWRDQPATTYTASRTLAAGEHEVKVEYYERGGDAVIQVSWVGGGIVGPTLGTLTPNTATAGGPAFTVTADGTNFVSGATLLWNGAARTTTFVSTTRVTAAIPASDVAAAGTASVSVRNPDGQTSNALAFTVTGASGCPAGQFFAEYFSNVALTPPTTRTACEATIDNVYGTGGPAGLPVDNFSVRWTGQFTFAAGSVTFTARADDGVRVFLDGTLVIDGWKDQPATTYTATRTLTAGNHEVKVEYYERGGDAVVQVTWTSSGAVPPAVSTLTPNTTAAGSPAFTLTIDGSGFVSGAAVLWNGAPRTTTFASATRVTAAIPATDVAAAGSAAVTVRNPDGQTSNALSFTVTPAGGGCATGEFFAEYFANAGLTGTPARTACESTINNDYGAGGPTGLPADNFSVRWTGRFSFTAGTYTFTARADDGVRLFVDGVLIIDQWHDGAATTYTATRTLTAGDHEAKVEYYERFGAALIQASWAAAP